LGSTSHTTLTALVLAGQRSADDPVAHAAGVCCKALAPVGGRPMVLRVLDALGASEHVGRRVLCGPDRLALETSPELLAGLEAGAWDWLAPRGTPSASAFAAPQALPASPPVLLTTADHALLHPEIVDSFCDRAIAAGVDLTVGLTRYAEVMAAFPGMGRTALRFRDDTYCGCNLYAFLAPGARGAADFWRRVEHERKRPWRLLQAIGWSAVARYLLGRLTLAEALERLSARLRVRVGHVLLPFPEAAVDVDKLSDWEHVQRVAARRAGPAKTGPGDPCHSAE
jgi:GTP:adenosylcobinamide-phosphate guanylyltransferase